MTQEEKDLIVGRTLRELKEARHTVGILRSDIDDYSRKLNEASDSLKHFLSNPIGKGPTGMAQDEYVLHFHQQLITREIQGKIREFVKGSERIAELERLASEF